MFKCDIVRVLNEYTGKKILETEKNVHFNYSTVITTGLCQNIQLSFSESNNHAIKSRYGTSENRQQDHVRVEVY